VTAARFVVGFVDPPGALALGLRMRSIILALALAGCAASPTNPSDSLEASPAASPAAVIAAEREFAADAAVRGWVAAFRRYAAADATTLSPDPVNAQESFTQIEGDGSTNLDWRPAFAGVARSGEFGFTTGPFQVRGRDGIIGHYFTVWRQQPDGSWKWIFDAGTDVRDPGPAVAVDADIPTLAIAESGVGSAEQAIAQVADLESRFSPQGLPGLLAADARVNRPFEAAAIGREAARALMNRETEGSYTSVRREASAAGDMVFSLGEVRDQHEGAERRRYYARVWQLQQGGWRIVFDEIVPRREPPPG
jgi:ketosteroid isomerase-like protein